jgi:hypothetical protein
LKFSLFSLLWLQHLKDSLGGILFLQTQQFVEITLHFLDRDQEEIRNTAKQSQAYLEYQKMGGYELRHSGNNADIKSRVAMSWHMEMTIAECSGVTGLQMAYTEHEYSEYRYKGKWCGDTQATDHNNTNLQNVV